MEQIPKPIPKLGLYPYADAVEDIAQAIGMSNTAKTSLLLEMSRAIRRGELQVRDAETAAPIKVTTGMDSPSPYASVNDVNRWLEARGFPYRWPPKHEEEQHNNLPIPGKLPNTSVGKLAITAAWQIECKEKRAATRDEVIKQLQGWADAGAEPDVLLKSDKVKRGVKWLTRDGKEKRYDIDACGKALEKWRNTRP